MKDKYTHAENCFSDEFGELLLDAISDDDLTAEFLIGTLESAKHLILSKAIEIKRETLLLEEKEE